MAKMDYSNKKKIVEGIMNIVGRNQYRFVISDLYGGMSKSKDYNWILAFYTRQVKKSRTGSKLLKDLYIINYHDKKQTKEITDKIIEAIGKNKFSRQSTVRDLYN